MLKLKTLAVTIALTGFVCQGCDRDKDDGSSDDVDQTGWEFHNTADKAAFQTRLADLEKLSTSAGRGAVPQGQTRVPSQTGTGTSTEPKNLASVWQLLDQYTKDDGEGQIDDNEATQPAAPGCAQLTSIFGFGGQAETRGTGFALSDGSSCGDAVKEMKSYYSQSLDALKQQIAWLKSMAPGTEICGMRVEELPVDAGKAAVGYKLVPSVLPNGMTFDQRLFGAANDTEVGYLTSLNAGCAAATGDCGTDFSVVGLSEAIGQLAEKKLKLRNEFAFTMAFEDPKHGGMQDVTTSMKSESEITGLNDTDLLKASEATTFELIGDPSEAPGAGAYKVTMSLILEELDAGRLLVTGSFLTNDSNLTPQTFRVEFQRSGGSCSVNTRVPEDKEPSPGTPGIPFDETNLQGAWVSDCDEASLGNFGFKHYLESTQFNTGMIARTLTTYSDSECFPGKEAATITLTGKYALSSELPDNSRYDEISEYGLDLTYDAMTVVLNSDEHVAQFNNEKICNKADWAKDTPAVFAVGECFFEVGTEPLLNDVVMKNPSEFTTVRPYANLVTLDMAQSTFFSGQTDSTRSRIAGGAVRTLKHQ